MPQKVTYRVTVQLRDGQFAQTFPLTTLVADDATLGAVESALHERMIGEYRLASTNKTLLDMGQCVDSVGRIGINPAEIVLLNTHVLGIEPVVG